MKRVLIFISILVLLVLLSFLQPYLIGDEELVKSEYEKETCFVNRVIDGDTLVCDNETIRLLGIDTPEKNEEGYQEAKDYLMAVDRKEVEMLRDWDDEDKYYRKLRYISYQDRVINIELVENGFATAFMTEKLVYEEKLIIAEKYAQENCFGVWETNHKPCIS